MFAKLRTARHLELQSNADRKLGPYRPARPAKPERAKAQYSQREVLVFSGAGLVHIQDQLFAHLATSKVEVLHDLSLSEISTTNSG